MGMESRIMENKILFLKSIQEGRNDLMKVIVRKMREDEDYAKKVNKEKERIRREKERKKEEKERREGKKENEGGKKKKKSQIKKTKGNRWMETLDKYLEILGINYDDIERKNKKEIKEIVRKYDDNIWKVELERKPLAKTYYTRKKEIKEEKIYDNRWSSVLLFRARANVLGLYDRKRKKKEEKERREGKKENEGVKKKKKSQINKTKGNRWMETLDKYLEILDINYDDIEMKNKKEIKEIVRKYD